MKRALANFNYISFFAMLALIAVGTTAIWSAGNARDLEAFHEMWIKNLTTAGIGMVIYFMLAFSDYRKILKWTSLISYLGAIAMLILVLVVGDTVFGGKRWLWFFQPSEISKICVIMFIAELFGSDDDTVGFISKKWRRGFRGFLVFSLVLGVPSLLILAEPDLGTTLTLAPAALMMIYAAKIWRKGLSVLIVIALCFAAILIGAIYEAEKPGVSAARRENILKYIPLRPHQVKRVKVFLFPEDDLRGAGYTLRQSKISIGSGGFEGKGIGKAETNSLKYLPPAISMNDFIFCVWAEETGYRGTRALLWLFALLLLPGPYIALRTADARGQLLVLGITTLVFAHVYINIGMAIGLVPITGLPLPFISSGRTFLITVMAAFGLIQSVSIHREEKI